MITAGKEEQMNANVLARLMHLNFQAFVRAEISREEFADIVQDLTAQARSAGIQHEAAAAYWQMCQEWFDRQAA
jgi:hypothetical protein